VTKFYSRFEKALRKSTTAAADGRLQGETDVNLADVANAAITKTAKAKYELFGPGDVQRLSPGAITRRFPAPNTSDAEVTKLALVEFVAKDLPWRYTPQMAAGGNLRPWIVLVIGQRAPDDIVLRPDGRVTLGLVAQNNHILSRSAQWAHVQHVDGHDPIARVIAPPHTGSSGTPGYLEDTAYVACLVPAFTKTGADSWDGSAPATVELYDWWTFRTGPQGDFPELAAKLHKADLLAIEATGKKPFGRAQVAYRSRTTPTKVTTLDTAGALRLPVGATPDPADAPPSADVAADVTALSARIVTPDGRGVITAPQYDAAFVDETANLNPVADGWIDQARKDPRLRGAAGLGAWNAIEWQDKIADAAAAKAGDLAIARARVNHVALGIEASRSLWRRRLPTDPVKRLAVLGPALGRLVTATGDSVVDTISGRTPELTHALLSSAARRALRPGPARIAQTEKGVAPFGDILVAANDCPGHRDAAEIRRGDRPPSAAIKRVVFEAARGDERLAEAILQALGDNPSPAKLAAALRALAPDDEKGAPSREAIDRFLSTREFGNLDHSLLEWRAWMHENGHPEPCDPIDLIRLSRIVTAAIDPTVARPPALERVLSTLHGITHIGPVEIEPELDLPLWSFLSDRAPDWMLPGAGDLIDGDVVGLSTNPVFVEALLVGANTQTTAELRWRNVPLVTRWSPLRKFWQRKTKDVDILPIKTWPIAAPFGSSALVPAGIGAEAVVVFRTSLFRRYPATVVYLYPATTDWKEPDSTNDLTDKRVLPTFTGTIGRDITFFGFSRPPSALATHWVVLEEPPAGHRFYQNPISPAPAPAPAGTINTSSNFAYVRFAVPVRVLIGPLL
jgi:hypothetical protein